MQPKHWIALGALIGAASVAMGAFGAHGLPAYLERGAHSGAEVQGWVKDYETAVHYHLAHAPLIVLVGVLSLNRPRPVRGLGLAGWLFVAGILLFSGFLYAWVLTEAAHMWMVHLVPVGGVLLIAAWIALAVAVWLDRPAPTSGPRP